MCDVYGETGFNLKHVYEQVKHGFFTMSLDPKDNPWRENTQTLVKKMLWVKQSVKKLMLTVFCDIKGFITID